MTKRRRLLPALAVLLCPLVAAAADDSPGLRYYYPVPAVKEPQTVEADVCVYGGTPAGVTAAVQAARMGKKTVLVVFGRHVGGMTSGGLSATDVGNERTIGGLARSSTTASASRAASDRPRRSRRSEACSRTPAWRSTSSSD